VGHGEEVPALCELQLFIMRLSASGQSFPRAYVNKWQEVFLDGHVRAFDHSGGVPGRIRYDNLKAPVVRASAVAPGSAPGL
jgi:transposase